MIDTDKYEGHTEGPWSIKTGNAGHSVKDANGDHVCTIPDPTGMSNKHIIADAPLLLAEVKRLREGIKDAIYLFQMAGNPKMTDKKRLEIICDFLLEMIE